jgi:CHAT domain-containing protein
VELWDIGDIPSAFFFRAFHESVRDGKLPTEALRSAQLACLRSNDASLRDPRVWAAFEIIERSL